MGILQSFEGKEGLDNSCFHIEDAGAVGFARAHAKGHFDEGADRIDGVIVAEDKKLRLCARGARGIGDAKMIAAMLLGNDFDGSCTLRPNAGEGLTATVGGLFFQTGGFHQR